MEVINCVFKVSNIFKLIYKTNCPDKALWCFDEPILIPINFSLRNICLHPWPPDIHSPCPKSSLEECSLWKALRRDNWSHRTQQWPQHSKPLMSTRFRDYNNYFQIRERVNKRLSLGRLVQEVCGGTTLSVVGKQWNCRGEIMEGDERAEVTWHCRKGSQR